MCTAYLETAAVHDGPINMVKAYLRYVQEASWGVVVSGGGNVAVDSTGRLAIAPALDAVIVWNIKTQAVVRRLAPAGSPRAATAEVTALALGSDGDTLAVGHADGTIRLWRVSDGEERTALAGHKGAVTALRFNEAATMLASGSNDTNVVVWDVVGEAGLCRLRGHRDAVTDVCLLAGRHSIASVSKDGTLKLWDLDTQHCVQTALAPSGELWSLDADGEWLITGGAAGEVLAWRLEQASVVDAPAGGGAARGAASADGAADAATAATPSAAAADAAAAGGAPGEGMAWEAARVSLLGPLAAQSSARVARLRFGLEGACIGCQYADRTLQLWSVQNEAQLKRQLKRRQAKRKLKGADGADDVAAAGGGAEAADGAAQPTDHFVHLGSVRGGAKLHSFAFMPPRAASVEEAAAAAAEGGAPRVARLLVAERNNALGVYELPLGRAGSAGRGGTGTLAAAVQAAGHRAEVRALALSSDDRMVASASDGEAKVWSVRSQQCLRTLPCGYALCVSFLCSSRYVAVGTKAGAIELFSFATGERCGEVAAHAGAVWSLALEPRGTALLSASADKSIVAWQPAEADGAVSLAQERSLALGDDALCAAYAPDGRHLAVGLLDATVRVLFADSFKQYLTLFGHKLPVLSLAISSDGALLVSASADKTVKVWGLDFGDCHRSLLAHGESVMAVQFVRDTHYFFSAGKDRLIKYWDADRFEQVLTLHGHHAEVWGLALTRRGDALLSCGRDRALRLWRRTDEQVFVAEEREGELEALFEAGLERQQQQAEAEDEEAAALGLGGGGGGAGGGGGGEAAAGAARRSLESVKGAERVLEALKTLEDEAERRAEHGKALALWQSRRRAHAEQRGPEPGKPPALVPNLLLLGLDEGGYLLKALASVRAAELEQALLLLPFGAACELLRRLEPMLAGAPPAELLARCVLFVLKVHHKQLVAAGGLAALLHRLNGALCGRLRREQARLGYNLAALGVLQQAVEEQGQAGLFFEDALGARDATAAASTAELRRKTVAKQQRSAKKHKAHA